MWCAAGVELNPAEPADALTRPEPILPNIGGWATELLAAIAIAASGAFAAGDAGKGGTVTVAGGGAGALGGGGGGATTRAGSSGGCNRGPGVSGIPPTSTGLG
jgi:hypothetical protein